MDSSQDLLGVARSTLAARCDPSGFARIDGEWQMPRIGRTITTSVVFLYPSEDHARRHGRIGGTGFIVGKPMADTGLNALYLVTNMHVVAGGSPVVRINRRDGGPPDILDLLDVEYVAHPAGDDLAIQPLSDHVRTDVHAFSFVPVERLVTPEVLARHDIGIGDEVFMVGRFVNLQGTTNNVPAVRFGNFSHDLDRVRLRVPAHDQECFAVEMRSRTGFSGAPVYVWGRPDTTLVQRQVQNTSDYSFIYLLGVNFGYIIDPDADAGEENTWLNGVVPAWKILELLNTPTLVEAHERRTLRTQEALAQLASTISQIRLTT
jgi:hypothetical protein